jgi:HK97 family phage major capsid protein
MFVKLSKDYDGHKAGDVIEIADEAIARSFITVGIAEASDAQALIQSATKALLDEATSAIKAELAELKRTAMNGAASNGPPPPPADEGVEFDGRIEATESPADRAVDGKAIARGIGEIIGLIARTAPKAPDDVRNHADLRLTKFYKLDRVSDFHDANLSNRGAPVSRAGTESMGGASGYGYFIKPELLTGYFEIAMEDSLIEPFARPIPVGATNEVHWPALDQYFIPGVGQTASAAGIRVFYKGEITQRQSSDAKVREILYKIVDLTGFTALSRDLVADNYISSVAVVQELFLRALAFTKDYMYVNGDGNGKPTGIRGSAALLTATRKNANKICLEDAMAMMAKFHQSRAKSAMWIAHQSCFPELLTIKYGGTNAPAFLPNASINQSSPFSAIDGSASSESNFVTQGTFLGKPIRFTTDKLEMLGTPGDFMLVDASSYGVATRQGVEVSASDQFLFDSDQIALRFKTRHDGKSLWTGPYTSTSPSGVAFKTSPFIQLDAGS